MNAVKNWLRFGRGGRGDGDRLGMEEIYGCLRLQGLTTLLLPAAKPKPGGCLPGKRSGAAFDYQGNARAKTTDTWARGGFYIIGSCRACPSAVAFQAEQLPGEKGQPIDHA